MRACQFCGVCSWGVVSNTEKATHLAPGYVWMQCDGCHSLARRDLIDNAIDAHAPVSGLLSATDPVSQAMVLFKESFPKPITRTERLVCALLQGHCELTGPQCVRFVREVEEALEASSEEEPETDWLAVRFTDRAAFETWMTHILLRTNTNDLWGKDVTPWVKRIADVVTDDV